VIFVIEHQHKSRLAAGCGPQLADTPLHVLDIPDGYTCMDPELVDMLERSVGRVLDLDCAPPPQDNQPTTTPPGEGSHMKDAQPCPLHIRIDRELTHPQVIALLEEHLAGMRAESPPECVFALDLDGLRRPEITFLTAWRRASSDAPGGDDELLAMGAIKELAPTTAFGGGLGELKSMRTSARHLRQGAAQAVLVELLAIAHQRGYARVNLETGSTPAFEPAVGLYRRFGFVACGPFAAYREDPFSRFLTLALA
jgi:putative acetyltransferase